MSILSAIVHRNTAASSQRQTLRYTVAGALKPWASKCSLASPRSLV
jgi:hypothetical protein